MMDILGPVKKHPYITGGVIIVGGLALLLFSGALGGGAATTSSQSSSSDTALAQSQLAAQVGLAQQASAQSFNLQYQSADIAGQLALKNLDLTAAEDTINAQVQQAQASLALAKYQTDAATQQQANNNATSLAALTAQLNEAQQVTQIQATTTQNLAALNSATQIAAISSYSDLEKLISNNQTSVAINQTNANVSIAGINAQMQEYIAKQQASAASSGGLFGFLGSVVGALF